MQTGPTNRAALNFWGIAEELLGFPAWWEVEELHIVLPEYLLREPQFCSIPSIGETVTISVATETIRLHVELVLSDQDICNRPAENVGDCCPQDRTIRWAGIDSTAATAAGVVRFLLGHLHPRSLLITTR